jgi:MoaA/NifB/PqqE/SkfB family radical SAM enzyme
LLLRALTARKALNLAALILSFHLSKWLRRPLHAGNPVKIGFEPTTSCNLRCPECPSGLRSFTRPTGMASEALFQEVVDQLHADLIYLLLYFQGEPYLHPQFHALCRYAAARGVYVATSTNGHYLTPEKARLTVESGLSEVIISVDGLTQETYEAYRVGGRLDKVQAGIRNLAAARAAAGTLHPLILVQFLVVRPNEHEVPQAEAWARSLGADGVLFKTAQLYGFEQGHALMPLDARYSRYRRRRDGSYAIKNPLHNQCWKLWQGAELTWDGRVLPCCFDKDAEHLMGILPQQTFREIWRSPAYDAFRRQLLRGRSEIAICRNCSEGTQVWA